MTDFIPFNKPTLLGTEINEISKAISTNKLSGDGDYNKIASEYIKAYIKSDFVALTPSCTSALEMAYLLIGVQAGDEVIMPSYTFTSTATSVALLGGTPVFVDIDDTCNIDVDLIIDSITPRTKAICV